MKLCDKHKDFAAPRDAALHDSEIVLFIESQLNLVVKIIWMSYQCDSVVWPHMNDTHIRIM